MLIRAMPILFSREQQAMWGRRSAEKQGLIGNTRWARSMHAKHIAKYRYDPTLVQRTMKGNRHPETTFPQWPSYESTLDLGYIP